MALNKKIQLEYSSVITDLTEANTTFDRGKLRVAYTGKNRNGSFISKASFEQAAPTMYGCPVVAHYIREDNEIGSHDGEFVSGDNGNVKYVNVTQPVGFIPPGAQYWWENIEDDGVIHQYFCTEVILWKRQEAYDKIKDNGITKHSMEIQVFDGEMRDDYYEVKNFEFTAFCLLGTAETCFESSALFTFSKAEVQEQLDEMLKEFKLAFCSDLEEKEVEPQVKFNELLEKYNVTVEDIDFEYENATDEELEALFEEHFASADNEPEDSEPETNEPASQDFALNSQIRDGIAAAVRNAETIIDEDYGWEFCRYVMVDFDMAEEEVYFEDMSDDWHLYGAKYSFDGDNVVVDFESKKRKKYAIVDYDEGTQASAAGQSFADVVKQSKAYCKQLKEDMDALVNENKKQKVAELFTKFDGQLDEITEYRVLKASCDQYSIEELEEKLYALVGRKQFTEDAPAAPKPVKAPVYNHDNTEESTDPYGTLFNFLHR